MIPSGGVPAEILVAVLRALMSRTRGDLPWAERGITPAVLCAVLSMPLPSRNPHFSLYRHHMRYLQLLVNRSRSNQWNWRPEPGGRS